MFDMENYIEATSVEEAIAALSQDETAIVIAGGTDVLIQTREGRHAGCHLVSIHAIDSLRGIRQKADGTLIIGALTTFSEITNSPILRPLVPILCDAVDQVGSPQIRNMGTIGGNVCNGVTSADSAPSLMVLDAALVLRGKEGIRKVPIREWYTGAGKTVRRHDEILLRVEIPKESYEGFFGHYIKYGKREAMEISTLGCAVMVKLREDQKTVDTLKIAFGVAAPTPIRCPKLEDSVRGKKLTESLIKEVGTKVLEEITPRDSWRASKAFRQQIAKEISRRAFKMAVELAGGEIDA